MKAKDIKTAIIWKKSIYDNNMKCKCGKKLFDVATNKLTDYCVVDGNDQEDNRIFCSNCNNLVAVYKFVPDDEPYGLRGSWEGQSDIYKEEFQKAEEYLKKLKEMTKVLNSKLSEIDALENKNITLENKIKNKEETISNYSKKLQELTKENQVLEHRLDEICEKQQNDFKAQLIPEIKAFSHFLIDRIYDKSDIVDATFEYIEDILTK